MNHQEDFAESFGGFLCDYAEQVIQEFDGADRIPLNLSLQFFESIVFLFARTGSILPYFAVEPDTVVAMKRSVKDRLLSEFMTVDPDRLGVAFESGLASYVGISETDSPFSESWYTRMFAMYTKRMQNANRPGKVFIWNLDRASEADPPHTHDQVLEMVHRAEIRHVVPFQRLVINFFNFEME